MADEADIKLRTARTIKWNVVDRLSTQVLYAVTGIVLARELSQEDFGLVGAVMVFHAFASLFVDSGFSSALIQRKNPTDEDYSTVLWFNTGMAAAIYVGLWFAAPAIADWFKGDVRLIPLSRAMFATFIINALSIVQANRLMKRMDVKMIAVSNAAGLAVGGAVGILMAVGGYGAWAVVWQSVVLSTVKTAVLWFSGRWLPQLRFSWRILRGFFSVGYAVMFSSLLNVVFQNIYSFFIGNRVGMVSLGYYSQSDKWSKMGVSSLSQVLTSSFLPVLSRFQDDSDRFCRAVGKMNRFTAYFLYPAFGLLIVAATPVFHVLFGEKWDPSIVLFRLLLVRGVFTVLTSLYTNYILSLGRSRALVWAEVLRDGVALAAVVMTLPYLALSTADNPVFGLEVLLWGQILASVVAWVATLAIAVRVSGRSLRLFAADNAPYVVQAAVAVVAAWLLAWIPMPAIVLVMAQAVVGCGVYVALNAMFGSVLQREAFAMLFRKRFD